MVCQGLEAIPVASNIQAVHVCKQQYQQVANNQQFISFFTLKHKNEASENYLKPGK